jgi:permease family protein
MALDSFRTLLAVPVGSTRARKPATLSYGLEESPQAAIIWISAIQHVGVCAIFMVYPLIIARKAGLTEVQTINLLQLGFLALAVATALQALPRGPIGSRLLAPAIFTGVYLAPSLLAVQAGGLPLVWGMTMFAGVVEMALSRVWSRLRPFIPPETAGLVVFLVGTIIGLAALRVMLEDSPAGALTAQDGTVGGCALAVMAALNIWNKGRLKLFCILIGMGVGYCVSIALGQLTLHQLSEAAGGPLIAFPHLSQISWSFDWSLTIPFAVTGLAAAMNSTAVLTTYQRLTDAEWVRPGYGLDRTRCAGRWDCNDRGGIAGDLRPDGFQRQCRACCGDRSRQPCHWVRYRRHPGARSFATCAYRRAGDHAARRDGFSDAVHRRLHHDQWCADHFNPRARWASHACRRHGDDRVLRCHGLSGRLCWRAALGAAVGDIAACAGDARCSGPQSSVPHWDS